MSLLETIRQENTTRQTNHAVETRHEQILERHDLAENSTRQGNLETACGTQRLPNDDDDDYTN